MLSEDEKREIFGPPSAGLRVYLVNLWIAKVLERNIELAREVIGKPRKRQLNAGNLVPLVVARRRETARGRKRFLLSHHRWRGGDAPAGRSSSPPSFRCTGMK